MKKYKVHIDSKSYPYKPVEETAEINKRITKQVQSLDIKSISEKIQKGHTILPYIMNGKRSINNFKECSLIFLDFDNTIKQEGMKTKIPNYISFNEMYNNTFVQNNACFMYETFSSTEEINRYRIVFALDRPIKKSDDLTQLLNYLISIFPTVDKASTKDISRIYYGGKKVKEINYNNTLNRNFIPKVEMFVEEYSKIPLKINRLENNLIKEISKKNIYFLKEKYQDIFNIESLNFSSKFDLIKKINSLDMSKLLGIDNKNSFRCILTDDQNPSASIIKHSKADMYIYKRFSDTNGFELNNIELFKILLNTEYTQNVLNFFIEVFNFSYQIPENLKSTNNILESFKQEIKEIVKNKTKYPNMYKVLKPHNERIIRLIEYLQNNYHQDKEELYEKGYLILNNIEKLSYVMYGEISKKSIEKSYKIINLLTYLRVINKLNFEEYPIEIKNYILNKKSKNKKTVNILQLFYGLNDFDSFMIDIEQRCEYLKENGYTFKGFSQDYITLLDSVSEANRVYTQTQNKTLSKGLIQLIEDIESEFDYQFNTCSKNYIIESELKQILKQKYYQTANNLAINYKKALIINLERFSRQNKKVSKKIQEDFNLDTDKYYNIIF